VSSSPNSTDKTSPGKFCGRTLTTTEPKVQRSGVLQTWPGSISRAISFFSGLSLLY
jgi:hypothetical protein